ncbi:MAG: RNA methyltransferase [Helicobacteraceae bacterium]|nr:RNA methyltransferase [Helicobacteraceae bacterium]
MKLTKVTDLNTPELQIYQQMRENAFSVDNSFVADSPKVVNLILQSDIVVNSVLATSEYYEEFAHLLSDVATLYVAEKKLMEQLVGHKIHHNCMLHGVRPKATPLSELDDHIIMLDEITSTENIGSIARSSAGVGVGSYLLPSRAPHPYSRRALRVSMGYVSKLKYHVYDDIYTTIKTLQSSGYKVYGAELSENSIPLYDVKVAQKWVVLMGHEGKGLSKEVQEACDEIVSIEMSESVKSFNVAVASAIIMHRFKNV